MSNPLTKSEKESLKDWANVQHIIARRYKPIDPVRSEFYHGRSVAAGKIAVTYNPKFRKATIGNWILLGKLHVVGTYCWICGKLLSGGQLVYSNKKTKKNIAVCSRCVRGFEKQTNPTLVMPIKSQKQLGHLFKAQSQLSKAGVGFDSGTSFRNRKPTTREWELDWSLKGGYMRNPMPKYIKGFRANLRYAYKSSSLNMFRKADITKLIPSEIEKILSILLETYYPIRPYSPGSYEPITKDEFMSIFRDTFKVEIKKMRAKENPIHHTKQGWFWGSVGPQPTKEKLMRQVRAIYAGGYKGRNPKKFVRTYKRTLIMDGIISRANELESIGKLPEWQHIFLDKDYLDTLQVKQLELLRSELNTRLFHLKGSSNASGYKGRNPAGLYQQFHGSPPKGTRKVKYQPPPKKVIKVGRITQIRYRPEYPSKHEGTEFYHNMGDTGEKKLKSNAILATDPQGEWIYILKDKDTKHPFFSGRGVIG